MEYTHYTDKPVLLARDLVNLYESEVGATELESWLAEYGFTVDGVTEDEVEGARRLAERLHAVFAAETPAEKAELLNPLLAESKVEPRLDAHGDRGPHFHYTRPDFPLVTRLLAYTAMGLATAVAMGAAERLGTCDAVDCEDAYIDTSRNAQKRFCSTTCTTRTNVKAYRERQSRQS